ncbi:MAG TPA: glutamate mutase L [Syntrophorhabdaceae bacterium]|nr:glutamate mutase L [Syntrophorhabdaceae bacterium]
MPDIGIFVDFGSTYTKVTALDLDGETLIAQGRTAITVRKDLTSSD